MSPSVHYSLNGTFNVTSKNRALVREPVISCRHALAAAVAATVFASPPAKASTADLAALSPADTLADLIAYIDNRTDWRDATRSGLKTAVRQIAWSLSLIQARDSGQPLDSDRKKLDLARIPFDIPAINRALKGMSYRLAGFNSDKSYRNAKTGLRRVGRALRKVAPDRPLELPPDSPYAPFIDQASRFEKEAARCFASRTLSRGAMARPGYRC